MGVGRWQGKDGRNYECGGGDVQEQIKRMEKKNDGLTGTQATHTQLSSVFTLRTFLHTYK